MHKRDCFLGWRAAALTRSLGQAGSQLWQGAIGFLREGCQGQVAFTASSGILPCPPLTSCLLLPTLALPAPQAIQAVRPPPPPPSGPPAPLPAPELSHSLYGVTDVLLTCFASAVAATRNDPSTRAALMAAYRTARTALLDDLLADAVAELRAAAVAGAGAGGLGGGAQAPGQQQWGALPPDLLIW